MASKGSQQVGLGHGRYVDPVHRVLRETRARRPPSRFGRKEHKEQSCTASYGAVIARGQQQRTLVRTYVSDSSFRSSIQLTESVIVRSALPRVASS